MLSVEEARARSGADHQVQGALGFGNCAGLPVTKAADPNDLDSRIGITAVFQTWDSTRARDRRAAASVPEGHAGYRRGLPSFSRCARLGKLVRLCT
ncbi:hypothetical protein MESS2_970004 [Mesorhizobium metallidurans STM 2683]|uniref:Uncharacterized protein n=1 Tax=Mesorhizobium metallidurans STM 2683 TaxID=1297569 RepID=M5EYY9_9HYPH|nr:hypothetical protein MESS2_970004 [Mesorhizobium metallidurans STM 2683]